MKYLFDTNLCIALIEEREVPRQRLERALVEGSELYLSSLVLYELSYGIHKSRQPRTSRARLEKYLHLFHEVLDFTSRDAERAGEIRAQLEKAAKPIGPYDVLIAGQALARDMILVTANTREFERVPGLVFQDWEHGTML